MTAVELLRARVEAELDRARWHDGHIPAADAREAILAALDEPLPEEEEDDYPEHRHTWVFDGADRVLCTVCRDRRTVPS